MASDDILEALGHAFAGATGTAFSAAAVYPLDLVTTRLKVQRQLRKGEEISESDQYRGILQALKAIAANEGGIPALYTGLTQDIVKSIVDSFLFFLFYTYFRGNRIRSRTRSSRGDRLPALEELALGAVAGACARAFTTPIANVVTRKQTSALTSTKAETKALTVRGILASIRAENGLAGLWAGYSASLLLTLNPSITFFLNQKLGKAMLSDFEESSQGAQTTFLLAAASKAVATTVTYPLQTAKARLQVQGSGDALPRDEEKAAEGKDDLHDQSPEDEPSDAARSRAGQVKTSLLDAANNSVIALVIRIAKSEGISALYDGLQGEVLKSFFSHGLTMVSKTIIHRFVVRLYLSLLSISRRRHLRMKQH